MMFSNTVGCAVTSIPRALIAISNSVGVIRSSILASTAPGHAPA
jgi:hypothetical protein